MAVALGGRRGTRGKGTMANAAPRFAAHRLGAALSFGSGKPGTGPAGNS